MAHTLFVATAPQSLRRRCADLALLLLALSVFALLTMSAELLANFGYHYVVPGGLPWEKIHPATIIAALALVARILASDRPWRAAGRILGQDHVALLLLLAIAVAAAHAVLVSKTPVTALIDTFVLPVLLFWLLVGLDPRVRRTLGILVCILMAANGTIGLVEYLTNWRLVPIPGVDMATIDPTRIDPSLDINTRAALADWRATALLGHPLENAVVTGALILCLSAPGARWIAPALRFPLLGVSLLAMVAFGGRASLVISLAGFVLFGLASLARTLVSGRPISRRLLGGVAIAIPLVAAAALAASESGFFDRLIMRFVDDAGSANARIVMWDLLAPLSWSDLLFGPDLEAVLTLQRTLGLELGIESFWLAITLLYGLIAAVLLFIGLALFIVRIVMLAGPGATAVMLFFFIVASTSTSLSSKTTGLGIVVLMVLCLLQRDRESYVRLPRWLREWVSRSTALRA